MTLSMEEALDRIRNLKENVPDLQIYEDVIILSYVTAVYEMVGRECMKEGTPLSP